MLPDKALKELKDAPDIVSEMVDRANGILFYEGDPWKELIEDISHKFAVTKPQADEIAKKIFKLVDGEIEKK